VRPLIGYIARSRFFDAVQAIAVFALCGCKITFVPMIVHTVVFWSAASVWPRCRPAVCSGTSCFGSAWPAADPALRAAYFL